MKLEIGKYYKTRNGDKVFLSETKEEGCAGFGEPHGLYLPDGRFGYMEKGRHHCACPDLDLIAEWTDTPEVGPVRTVTTTRIKTHGTWSPRGKKPKTQYVYEIEFDIDENGHPDWKTATISGR